MSNAREKPTSWGWIIFWFIIFWPVGLYLLIKRLRSDKSATLERDRIKTLTTLSYVLMGFGAIYLIMTFTEDTNMLLAAVLFADSVIGYQFALHW